MTNRDRLRTRTSRLSWLPVAAMLVLGGCGIRVFTQTEAPASTNEAGDPAATTPDGTGPATTQVGTPGTTVPTGPVDCDGFLQLSAYQRMLAVSEDRSPSDAACAEQVGATRASLQVFEATERLYEQHDVYANDFATGFSCADGQAAVQFSNSFDAPILIWGVATFHDASGATIGFTPFMTIPLGKTVSTMVEAPAPKAAEGYADCFVEVRVTIAPDEDYTADAGLGSLVDGPQSSNDPAEWLPELEAATDRARQERSLDLMVADVEDIHSPDLFGGMERWAETSPSTVAPTTVAARSAYDPEQWTNTVCDTVFQFGTEGKPGELRMLSIDRTNPTAELQHSIALVMYRRGSDGVWRYFGSNVAIEPPNDETCAVPHEPLPTVAQSFE